MNRSAVVIMMMWGAAWLGALPVSAEHRDPTLAPYFFVESGAERREHFPLKSTSVAAVISGVIADVTVNQTYANLGNQPINARYVFPASTRAAVHGMRMTVGEEIIKARIEARQEAQQAFENAKEAGKNAALLEQQRPNVFSMQVANIMPGESVAIDLHYSELLVPEAGMYQFLFPTVVGPRYSTLPAAGADDHHRWLHNPYLDHDQPPASSLDIRITLAGALPLQQVACSSHAIDIAWQNSSTAHITLAAGDSDGGNRDFILDYRLSGDQIHSGLMLYQGESENFFLLMVQPPHHVAPDAMPPREYIFVLDVSGSMHGFPLDTAKLLMKELLAGLRPEDRFNVILFAGASRVMARRSIAANSDRIQAAIAFIDNQHGGGGTELARALEAGLRLPHEEGYARNMVVVTDGYIAAEKAVFGLVADHVGRCNVFTFGIGSSVNRYLVQGLAKAGQGEPFVVTDPQEAAAAAGRFRRYIEAPVLTDIALAIDGFDAYDLEPFAPADLFAQRPLILCGKWRGQREGTIAITGTTGSGPHEDIFDVSQASPADAHGALSFLWARRRLERLSDFAPAKENHETRDQVTQIGLTYNLLTAYTSFVAVYEKVRTTDVAAQEVDQPLPLPHHVSRLAVGARHVPEPELSLMVACVVLPGLWIAWRLWKSAA